MRWRALCVMFLLTTSQAQAMTVAQFIALRIKKDATSHTVLLAHVRGLSEGLQWMQAAYVRDGKAPLYCVPETVTLTNVDYVQMLDKVLLLPELQDQVVKNYNRPVLGGFLLNELQERYPCKKK